MPARLKSNHFLVVGRAGMDLYADPPGTELALAKKFTAMLGGSAANIAAGICRQGGSADIMTAVSTDSVGDFVLQQLQAFGIGHRFVDRIGDQARSSLAVVETRTENCKAVIYRNGAADLLWNESRVLEPDYQHYGAVIISGTVFAAEPARASGFAAIKAAQNAGVPVILDVDYRAYSWESIDEAARTYRKVADLCDVVVGNDEEFDVMAGGSHGGLGYAQGLARSGQRTVVYKRGKHGSRTFDGDVVIDLGVYATETLKPTGAGDAFMAGFVISLSNDDNLQNAIKRGSASAALVVSRVGCSEAMPLKEDVEDVVKHRRFIEQSEGTSHAHSAQ